MFWVFIDLDGTILSKDDIPRPYIEDLFFEIRKMGGMIIVWSAGGINYSLTKIARLGPHISNMVNLYAGKSDGIEEKYGLTEKNCFFVDDHEELLKSRKLMGHGTLLVSYYKPDILTVDTELLTAIDKIKEWKLNINESLSSM